MGNGKRYTQEYKNMIVDRNDVSGAKQRIWYCEKSTMSGLD
ncbi:hypothetical protein [uncultured Clostridium sp.]|nr:hypothetical protein [uncultured Clostridium sp.]